VIPLAIALAIAAAPQLTDVTVSNGGTPFAGDRALLATVSPNGDGFRDRAIVSFRLDRPARVVMEAVQTDTIRAGRPPVHAIWRASARLRRGRHRLVWAPARSTPPRTYVLRLTVRDAAGRTRVYGAYRPGGRQNAPVVRVQTIEAGFTRRSYAPGDLAELSIATDASSLRLQVFTYGNQTHPTPADLRTSGVAMTPAVQVDWTRRRNAPSLLRVVRAGEWPSGLYFLRLTAGDGRVGYAPLIVRPPRLGVDRVAVVLATNTWQAYNFADENGDGWGDSWYVSDSQNRIDLSRPYLDFGVPFRFRDWDLTFIAWLNRTGKRVDYLSDDDLERVASGAELAKAYDLIVFPGHEEYVTGHVYDVVERYRDFGGNLAFLAANNFFRRVDRVGQELVRGKLWRQLGRPEARLVGTQYVGSNHGAHQAGYVVTGAAAAPWLFDGTGLGDGDVFGAYGIEADSRTPASPPGTQLLARIPDVIGPGRSAEMTYYETAAGAKVFASGTLNFAASLDRPPVTQLVENLWARLSRP
jgi:hypothetical protein